MNRLPNTLIRFLYHFVTKQPLSFLIFLIAPVSVVLKANVIPYALKMVIDTISNPGIIKSSVFTSLRISILLGGGAWLGFIIIERFQTWVQSRAIPKFESNIRISVMGKRQNTPS